ncbi:MAG: radical SAM protein [Candidatus Omnitrophica bacterium]|nr:radical SAM protein [Candidatus Omnitrophota bacterium]
MKIVDYDRHIFMNPSLICNFDCIYCRQHDNHIKSIKEFNIENFVQRLNRYDKTFLVTISGGEPFLIPNFIEFISELTKKHYVRIDTNLSLTDACRRFANTIAPSRVVEIVFSTHVLEREKRKINLLELVSLVKEFQKKGFAMVGNYVVYPPLIGRMERDIDFFNSRGIRVLPNLLQGKFEGKMYPLDNGCLSYSKDELESVIRLNPYAKIPLHNPRNELCQAGCTAFFINDQYEVSPCFTMRNIKLGDFSEEWGPYPKVIRCPKEYCTDQYNKTLCCSLAEFHLGLNYTQLKAILENGASSPLESRILLGGGWKKILSNKLKKIFRYPL